MLALTRLIVSGSCGAAVRTGAVWCWVGRVVSWVRALGFPPFSLSPDTPDLLDARHKKMNTMDIPQVTISHVGMLYSQRNDYGPWVPIPSSFLYGKII